MTIFRILKRVRAMQMRPESSHDPNLNQNRRPNTNRAHTGGRGDLHWQLSGVWKVQADPNPRPKAWGRDGKTEELRVPQTPIHTVLMEGMSGQEHHVLVLC